MCVCVYVGSSKSTLFTLSIVILIVFIAMSTDAADFLESSPSSETQLMQVEVLLCQFRHLSEVGHAYCKQICVCVSSGLRNWLSVLIRCNMEVLLGESRVLCIEWHFTAFH